MDACSDEQAGFKGFEFFFGVEGRNLGNTKAMFWRGITDLGLGVWIGKSVKNKVLTDLTVFQR